MSIKVAINGFGRIGRCTLRAIYEQGLHNEFEVVAINASGDLATNAHLLRYDTTHGRFATSGNQAPACPPAGNQRQHDIEHHRQHQSLPRDGDLGHAQPQSDDGCARHHHHRRPSCR